MSRLLGVAVIARFRYCRCSLSPRAFIIDSTYRGRNSFQDRSRTLSDGPSLISVCSCLSRFSATLSPGKIKLYSVSILAAADTRDAMLETLFRLGMMHNDCSLQRGSILTSDL